MQGMRKSLQDKDSYVNFKFNGDRFPSEVGGMIDWGDISTDDEQILIVSAVRFIAIGGRNARNEKITTPITARLILILPVTT